MVSSEDGDPHAFLVLMPSYRHADDTSMTSGAINSVKNSPEVKYTTNMDQQVSMATHAELNV